MNIEKSTRWMFIGGLVCALYVILGAFGAHGLENKLSASELGTYETGLRYMITHSLGMILINGVFVLLQKFNRWVNFLLLGGFVFFSLSLIIHATRNLLGIELDVFALFAPIGGLSYVAAWIVFAFTIRKK